MTPHPKSYRPDLPGTIYKKGADKARMSAMRAWARSIDPDAMPDLDTDPTGTRHPTHPATHLHPHRGEIAMTPTKAPTKKQLAAQAKEEARATLRGILKPGDTVFCVLEHVSKSGMRRRINFYAIEEGCTEMRFLSGYIARALGYTRPMHDRSGRATDGVQVDGGGMDMGFAVVYELGRALWPTGFGCVGKGCPSNDHSNGDRDYRPHDDGTPKDSSEVGTRIPEQRAYRHYHGGDGGYALKHRWL